MTYPGHKREVKILPLRTQVLYNEQRAVVSGYVVQNDRTGIPRLYYRLIRQDLQGSFVHARGRDIDLYEETVNT
jgi:hypothetical protein